MPGLIGHTYPLRYILNGLAMGGLIEIEYEGFVPHWVDVTNRGYAALKVMKDARAHVARYKD